MGRITEPMEIENEALLVLAMQVAYDAKLGEALAELEHRCDDLPPAEQFPRDGDQPIVTEETDALAVALHLLTMSLPTTRVFIEDAISLWLADDPEHAAIVRLTLLLPWQDARGQWHPHTPIWIRFFGEIAASAEEKFGPFGPRPVR